MFTLHKGDCEHCCRIYHYTLLHAGFGDYSYAYCDRCGTLATFDYSSSFILNLPALQTQHQAIEASWHPFIAECACGGHFRSDASPRCVFCSGAALGRTCRCAYRAQFSGRGPRMALAEKLVRRLLHGA